MSVLLAHIAFNIPIVADGFIKLSEMNPSMITAARDLGATSSQVLTRIVLPAITPEFSVDSLWYLRIH